MINVPIKEYDPRRTITLKINCDKISVSLKIIKVKYRFLIRDINNIFV